MPAVADRQGLGMAAISNDAGIKDAGKPSFWKKNKTVPGSIKPVYGAQHPPIETMPSSLPGTPKKELKGKQKDSFQDFQAKTNDAWDDGDDDLIAMANVKLSLRDIQSTAQKVIEDHSKQKLEDAPEGNSAKKLLPENAKIKSLSQPNTTRTRSPASLGMQGPGIGVRLSNSWNLPRPVPIRTNSNVVDRDAAKLDKLKSMLSAQAVELDELRKASWSGIPHTVRPLAWKLLSGYIPPILDRRQLTLDRKRSEYYGFIEQYFETRHQDHLKDTFRQIHIDIPRMNPLIPLFQQKIVQEIFERILYIWAIRHPASGYVQGINDLVTPFFITFLSEYIAEDAEIDNYDISQVDPDLLRTVEADCFWCTSKLLDGIQDNYTFAQPGIQTKVNALKNIITRISERLHSHLEKQHVEYLQFSFRWMNNLLMRELPLRCTIRLWDTYLSEPDGFADFHLYVCAAFLVKFETDLLREKDFHGLLLMLQNLPTMHWQDEDIALMVAEAYRLKCLFSGAPMHLIGKG